MKRSKFSLSHYKLLTCDMGELVPICCEEVLPGDTFQHSTSALVRVSPLLAPVMHPVHVRIHHWYVPYRLLWDQWESFITGGADGMDASVFPTVRVESVDQSNVVGQLADYLSVPTGFTSIVSALPFRAYTHIYNEWYRDQDLAPVLPISKASGLDTTTNKFLQAIAWEKDYFTSARPWTQKGPEVTIPIQGEAVIRGIGTRNDVNAATPIAGPPVGEADGTNVTYPFAQPGWATNGVYFKTYDGTPGSNPDIHVDMQNVTATNINDLRLAFALQRYEEARARYGSRYTEYLRYLGVRSSDARLQRPEYLGGGKQTIQFSEVLQTGPDDPDAGQIVGGLKGHGIGAVRSNRYRRFFEEHGVVMTLLSVRPKTMYVQGLSKMWNRRVKEDFWQKELEHIGQQEIANKEIYAGNATPDGVWGYQDRYDEYRRRESSVAGEFRTTLDFWHMARIFSGEPVLNHNFVACAPTKRINAVQTEDVLWVMTNHSIQARRMLSKMGTSYIY